MNMNPAALMRIMQAKNTFTSEHPKFANFVKYLFSSPIEEGTVFEVSITRPGEEKVTANMKVTAKDLEILNDLKSLQ